MNEIDWLAAEQPSTPPPSRAATAEARAALLTHTREPELVVPEWLEAAAARPTRPQRRRRGRRLGVPVAAGLVVAAAVVGVTALSGGADAPSRIGPATKLAPPPAVAKPLVRLSHRIQAQPQDEGDATLVERKHVFPHSPSFTGADLYLDDGRYYYAQTRAGLSNQSLVEPEYGLEVASALAAQTLPPDQARRRMIDATFGPAGEPTATVTPSPAEQEKLNEIKMKNGGKLPPPASKQTLDDNRVWIGATDALLAGAGRKDVRAGVMALLATIKTVRVEEGTDGGHAVVTLTATDYYPKGYEESYVVDATTGIPLKMIGGIAGKAPDVTVTYRITRVKAADVLGG